MVFRNLLKVFKGLPGILGFFVGVALIGGIILYFTDYQLISVNYGIGYKYANIVFDVLTSLLFGLFLAASLHKIIYFSSFNPSETFWGTLGGFASIFVTGCPSCTITVAYHMGLASLFTGSYSIFGKEFYLLPWGGIEFKIIGSFILIFALYNALKNLEVCKIKFKKN